MNYQKVGKVDGEKPCVKSHFAQTPCASLCKLSPGHQALGRADHQSSMVAKQMNGAGLRPRRRRAQRGGRYSARLAKPPKPKSKTITHMKVCTKPPHGTVHESPLGFARCRFLTEKSDKHAGEPSGFRMVQVTKNSRKEKLHNEESLIGDRGLAQVHLPRSQGV
jgi:hypothetical protein